MMETSITAMISLLTRHALLLFACAACNVCAQSPYPVKPIRLIVPFPPGGQTDIVARLLAPRLTAAFGQSIVIDNRGGGAGSIGVETAVRSAPDGYTVIIVSGAYAANTALYRLPYDPVTDLAPIALLGVAGIMAALHPSIPVANTRELIAFDRTSPGRLNFGSGGTGTTTHLAGELFNQMAGTKLTHVPYKGAGPALIDLLGGQIQMNFGSVPTLAQHVKTGRLRGIAVTTARRVAALPDVPAFAETLPGYEALNWSALLGPKALPRDIVTRWNSEINRALQLPDIKERMANDGLEPAGGTPRYLGELIARDVVKWRNVVKFAGIKTGN
jgi:tripartite-type tricarboxylate transporter receptor subunit TctC